MYIQYISRLLCLTWCIDACLKATSCINDTANRLLCVTGDLAAWLNGIVFALFRHLVRGNTPARISGCWQPDLVWWVALRMNMPSPRLLREHCALCWWWWQARRSSFQQKQEVRIGGFLLPGPFFPPGTTPGQTETMCVLTPWTSAYSQPGCPAGKWCGLSNNMWSQEAFSPSPFHYCYLNPVSV